MCKIYFWLLFEIDDWLILMPYVLLQYHVYPANAESLVKEKSTSFYMFACDIGEGLLRGYNMISSQNGVSV